jgi:hypothetical protein
VERCFIGLIFYFVTGNVIKSHTKHSHPKTLRNLDQLRQLIEAPAANGSILGHQPMCSISSRNRS